MNRVLLILYILRHNCLVDVTYSFEPRVVRELASGCDLATHLGPRSLTYFPTYTDTSHKYRKRKEKEKGNRTANDHLNIILQITEDTYSVIRNAFMQYSRLPTTNNPHTSRAGVVN